MLLRVRFDEGMAKEVPHLAYEDSRHRIGREEMMTTGLTTGWGSLSCVLICAGCEG